MRPNVIFTVPLVVEKIYQKKILPRFPPINISFCQQFLWLAFAEDGYPSFSDEGIWQALHQDGDRRSLFNPEVEKF